MAFLRWNKKLKCVLPVTFFILFVTFSALNSSWFPAIKNERNDTLLTVFDSSEISKSSSSNLTKVTTENDNEHEVENIVIDVLLQFVNSKSQPKLRGRFQQVVKSMLKYATVPINLHLVADEYSYSIARGILDELEKNSVRLPRLIYHNSRNISKLLAKTIQPLQFLFSSRGSYYESAIFFIAVALHRILPTNLTKLIMFDLDMDVRGNILNLYRKFRDMRATNIMALAREQQPVYYHLTWWYRSLHKNESIGDPPPYGKTGFNSGTKLLNLQQMRVNKVYNSYLDNPILVKNLVEKYNFRGHLGDQDFYTLLSFEHPELFHVLPCQWNRQLCTWWRDSGGYEDIFDKYHHCSSPIYVYHGNCNTPYNQSEIDLKEK